MYILRFKNSAGVKEKTNIRYRWHDPADQNAWKRQISQFGGEPELLPAKYRQNGKIYNQAEKVNLTLDNGH